MKKRIKHETKKAELKILKLQLLAVGAIIAGVIGAVLSVALQVFMNVTATPDLGTNLQDKVVTHDHYHFVMFVLIFCGCLIASGILLLMATQKTSGKPGNDPAAPPQGDVMRK